MLLGLAMYNRVILDLHFPFVVYKKVRFLKCMNPCVSVSVPLSTSLLSHSNLLSTPLSSSPLLSSNINKHQLRGEAVGLEGVGLEAVGRAGGAIGLLTTSGFAA